MKFQFRRKENSRIIIRVLGGLGNQLFIYAFAKALALKTDYTVYLEIKTGFIKDPYRRRYRLNNFNIKLKKCPFILSLYFPLQRIKFLNKLFFPNSILIKEGVNFEKLNSLIEENYRGTIFISGLWQNSDFFNDLTKELKKDLKIKEKILSTKNKELGSFITSCNSICVHVRRIQFEPVLSFEYYQKAFIKIFELVENPVFFIFSDDLDWCKENFKNIQPIHYIDHNNSDEISDLWLMTKCKNFIIANSTFSWWGAWLSENNSKVQIFPNDYLNGI